MRFAGSGSLNSRCPGENNTSGTLKKEQKKLEKMILEAFEKGKTNLGDNEEILNQSTKVDTLIVNEMLKTAIIKRRSVTEK